MINKGDKFKIDTCDYSPHEIFTALETKRNDFGLLVVLENSFGTSLHEVYDYLLIPAL